MQNVPVERFGGLRLDADPGELGWAGAASAQNTEFDLNGTVRTRPGFDQVNSATVASPLWIEQHLSSSEYVLIGGDGVAGTYLRVYNSSWVTVTSEAAQIVFTHAIPYGTTGAYGTADFLFFALPAGVAGAPTTGYVLTTTLSFTATNFGGRYLAVSPNSNRLVLGSAVGPSPSLTEEPSRVAFSDPGNPLTVQATNYVDLDPGDGTRIRMLVTWGNNLFVFKDTKFYVFYGESTDVTGGAIFNYRTVDTGVGCGYSYAACAAQDGVYFVHADGVYRTTGGTPELVSGPLQPFFDGRTNGFFTPTGPLTSPRIHAGDDRLYVWQQGATGMFVMDLRSREWTYWVLGVAPYALFLLPDPREFLFANSTGQLYKFSPDFTDDDGTAIASSYQSGFALLDKGQQVDVRDFDVYGSGTVTLALAADGGAVNATANGDGTVGGAVSTALATGLNAVNVGALCRDLSFKLSAASGAWSVDRLAARVQGGRDWT